mgnify:CR=1 FL=1
MAPRYFVETLGCPKNAVDSDKVVASLLADGYEASEDPEGADLLVVNTCAFIEAARPTHPSLIDRHHVLAGNLAFWPQVSEMGDVIEFDYERPVDGKLDPEVKTLQADLLNPDTTQQRADEIRAWARPRSPLYEIDKLNARRRQLGLDEMDAVDFLAAARDKMKLVGLREEFLHRPVNEGFSGGEKKRNEIFQMAMLEPRLAILDETDSGLDVDALRMVAAGVNSMRSPERSIVMITHYQRLLDYIRPDFIHVLAGGRIVRSGGPELALEVEQRGYHWVEEHPAPAA